MKKKSAVTEALKTIVKVHPWLTIVLVALIACSALSALVPPLVLETIVDRLTDGNGQILAPAVFYTLATIASCLLEAAREWAIAVFGQKIIHELRSQMSRKLTRIRADYFTENEPGTISARMVNDVDAVDTLFTSGIISMFSDLLSIIGIMAVVFAKSRGLFVILLIALPVVFAFTRAVQKRMLAAQLDNRKAVAQSSAQIPETISDIRSIHINDAQQFMETRYEASIDRSYDAVNRSSIFDSFYSPVIITLSSLIIAAMMVLSVRSTGIRMWFGMSVGTSVALIAYVGNVFSPLESIGMEIQNIQEAQAGLKRLDEFMNEPERAFSEGEGLNDGTVDISHVTFGYEKDNPVLNDFSMHVDEGEMVTLAGRTGAGKTTLFRLLLGLYAPDHGSVKIGGRKADAIPDDQRRNSIGCVEQRFVLIPGTIKDQITLRDPEISDEMVHKALRLVGMEEAVKEAGGLEAPCTSSLFSQGQFQLLSIARAIASEPRVVLLDEITANLDSLTEKKVLEALQKASAGRTTISISHRLYEHSGGRIVMIGNQQDAA